MSDIAALRMSDSDGKILVITTQNLPQTVKFECGSTTFGWSHNWVVLKGEFDKSYFDWISGELPTIVEEP